MSTEKNFFLSFALSLRGRLLVLICLATLPSTLFTFYIAQEERRISMRSSLDQASYLLKLLSREHMYQLSGARQLLGWLSSKVSQERYRDLLLDPNFLSALLAGYPQLGNIAVLNPDGDVLSSAYPVQGQVNLHRLDAIQQALKSDQIETGIYVVGPIVKRPLLHLAQSVKDKNGKTSYVVFVAIDLAWMKRLVDKVQLPPQHIFLIVDRDGTVLTSSESVKTSSYAPGKRIPELQAASLKSANSGLSRNRGDYAFATSPIEDLPGVLIATAIPLKRLSDTANQTFFKFLSLLSLLTVCTAASVVFLEELALLRYLRALAKASRRFGEGDFSARVSMPRAYGELHKMAEVFNKMAETLTSRHQEITEVNAQLDRLSRHLQIAKEAEAERIARDLHDEVGQVLTSIKLDLDALERKLFRERGEAQKLPESLAAELSSARAKIDSLVDLIRQIASDLRPPLLDRMGLPAAIELLVRSIEKKSELAIDLDISGDNYDKLDSLLAISIYRIAQEALTNILRHARASLVAIKLQDTGTEILLSVADDGIGMDDLESHKQSLGIIGMRERARSLNGTLNLVSTKGKGTLLSVLIPRAKLEEGNEDTSCR